MPNDKLLACTPDRLSGSLDRGLAILEVLSNSDAMTVTELAILQEVHRSTIVRLIQTLAEGGFVMRTESGRWTVGPRLIEIGARALGRMHLRDIALPLMKRLAEVTNESVQLTFRSGDDMFVIEAVESSHAVRVGLRLGHREPLYPTATGKAILAFLPDSEVAGYLKRVSLTSKTPRTIIDQALFLRELDKVREVGYSTNDEESVEGVRFVGAPIFDAKGTPVAALILGAPASRLSQAEFPRHGVLVLQVADQISDAMRYVAGNQKKGSPSAEHHLDGKLP